ncbi:cytochrome oxidase complex assembly protein 1-domain-containing protein [Phakopsora pachyrhizi]|uniref:Cytochrome oxidase complex assembly protein 1-domain-containing protein n=1 Tax=Phakopsora pachyrhizi TaxID=170000 RepID=A0AAV0AZB8_PHAPC|nr:cytochrome oxidase complex assembly protein 1-domain-containing protein [Phakopsora pachyrhizi]CAH7675962.1 cytochrome oxidase complex assembly protein 1-domain-containing protein [Phakopsora pachyrhizi]
MKKIYEGIKLLDRSSRILAGGTSNVLRRHYLVRSTNQCYSIVRTINTSTTAYPSGSFKNPTVIVPSYELIPGEKSNSNSKLNLPRAHRKLPDLPNRKPFYILTFVIVSTIWISFIKFSTNSEKSNSSIVKSILFELRNNSYIRDGLGDSIKPERDNFFGQLWVDGQINLMQGLVDVAFRVTGSKGSGKVYFTSLRRDRQADFEIVRWKFIRDDGEIYDLEKQSRSIFFQVDGDSIVLKPRVQTNSSNVLREDQQLYPEIRLV